LDDLGIDGTTILIKHLKKQGVRLWAGFISLRIEPNGGLLWAW
jgi:hypothetical protein